jgi:peroxiredoxin
MKQLTFILMIATLMASCSLEPKGSCLVSGTVKNSPDKAIYLTIGTHVDTLALNSDGAFYQEIAMTKPSDATLRGSRVFAYLFLMPGKDLIITTDASDMNKDMTFTGGLANENAYLLWKTNSENQRYQRMYDAYRSPFTPADFKRIRDSLRLADLDHLNNYMEGKANFDPVFVTREKMNIQFSYYTDLDNYPTMSGYYNTDKPEIPADWYSFLDGVKLDDPSLLDLNTASDFLSSYIRNRALKLADVSAQEAYYKKPEVIAATFKVISQNFTHPEFFNKFAFDQLKGAIDSDGTTGISDLITEYQAKSTDEAKKGELKEMTDAWANLEPGKPAPDFTLPNIDGKMVSLSDFAGKYVFIDFWATWCGPCKIEIPSYKKLINDYASKNIAFISISVDKDKSAWESMVHEGIPDPADKSQKIAMTWTQLHDAVRYNKLWLVKYIPTFVLIDPQGKIVESRAMRPSNPELRNMLDGLKGI